MKKIFVTLFVLVCLSFFVIDAYATEDLNNEISEKLFSANNEITDILEDFGITSLDYESIYSISFKNIWSYFKEGFFGCLTRFAEPFSKLLIIIVFIGIVSIVVEEKKYKLFLGLLVIPIIILILIEEVNTCLSAALSLIKLNNNFMISFAPLYAITVAVAGNPGAAITYNTLVIGVAEIVSAIINYGFIDIIGCYFCLCIGFSLNGSLNFSRFINSVNRFISFALGIVSSVFAAVLSIKGIYSAAADSAASKTVRFAISTLIPVIGSSLSDAYSTFIGSINILKGSVAIIGIIAVVLVNLPVLTEIFLFNTTLNILGFVSELSDINPVTSILRGFAVGIKIIGLLVIFEAFILIVSTAVMLSLKGG